MLTQGLLDLENKFQILVQNNKTDKLCFETAIRKEMQDLTRP